MAYYIKEIIRYFTGGATTNRDSDRSFILLGKTNSGKSTLANLLLWREEFAVHKMPEAFGLTKHVKSCDAKIDPSIVYGKEVELSVPLKIQVFDQPGSNDRDFTEEEYCSFLTKCIAESKGEMSANFLILINLSSDYLSSQEILTIMNIAEILSRSSYSFFPNATIVFTHSDKVDPNLNEERLEQELSKIVKEVEFTYIEELLNLVGRRHIFVNGVNKTPENRNDILRKLFQLNRVILNVYVNGNNGFKGKELKTLLGIDPDAKKYKTSFIKYDVEYQFNPDLNLFRRYETLDIGHEITQALNKLSGIGKGVSVMILLVSLEEMFSQEIYDLISNLPETYRLGEDFKKDFWDYACILFKSPDDNVDNLKRNISHNSLLERLVETVKSRYALVSKSTSAEECSDKILDLVRRVKLDTEGKTYIDSTVLREMRDMIQESMEQRKSTYKSQVTEGITNQRLIKDGIPIYKTMTDSKVVLKTNDFFWSSENISPRIGYFILKNMNADKAMEFKDKYKNQRLIKTEEFAEFCLKVMEKM